MTDFITASVLTAASLNQAFNTTLRSINYFGVTGTADDSATFAAALAAVAAGGSIFVPAGSYNIGSALSQAITGAVTFEGAGSGVTILNFFNATDGIAFNLSGTANVHVRGMTISRTAAGGAQYANTGLTIACAAPQPLGPRIGLISVQDVMLRGDNARTIGWLTSLSLSNVSLVGLDHLSIVNPNANGSGNGIGISWSGLSSSSYGVDSSFNDISVQGGSIGISIGQFIQGLYLVNSRLIGLDYGILWDGIEANSDIALLIANTHFNTSTRGVKVTQNAGIFITNTLSLHFNVTSLTGDWVAFEIISQNTNMICNNTITGIGSGFSGTECGIILAGGVQNKILGNQINNVNFNGIWLIDGANNSTIIGNSATQIGNVWLADTSGSTTNQQLLNMNSGVQDLTMNAAGDTIYSGIANVSLGNATNPFAALSCINVLASGGLFVGTATGAGAVLVQGPAGSNRELQYFTGLQSGADLRWGVGVTATGEGGSDSGSDFHIRAIGDTGAALGNPIVITRSTQLVTFGNQIAFSGAALPGNFANDAAAAAGGVGIGQVYRNASITSSGSVMMVRVT